MAEEKKTRRRRTSVAAGLGIDSGGNPVIDPTDNVLSLVDKEVTRLNDISNLRERYEDKLRISDEKIRNAESRRIDEVGKLREAYTEKLAVAESKRNDANRAFDLGNVAIASERATQQAAVLAGQLQGTAETLRTITAASDMRNAQQLQGLEIKLNERIVQLEKTSNYGTGKQAVSEPRMEDLIIEVKKLQVTGLRHAGEGEGKDSAWKNVAVIVSLLIGLAGVIFAILKA
jgi:hypothetical protein